MGGGTGFLLDRQCKPTLLQLICGQGDIQITGVGAVKVIRCVFELQSADFFVAQESHEGKAGDRSGLDAVGGDPNHLVMGIVTVYTAFALVTTTACATFAVRVEVAARTNCSEA